MFSEIGNLKKYWHVIALANEIPRKGCLKRLLYSRPLLIWRDASNGLYALADCCAHRKSPIEVLDYSANTIGCPYHGWQYDSEGNLTNIPSSPQGCKKLKCAIPQFKVLESEGFIWIHLDVEQIDCTTGPPGQDPGLQIREFSEPGWKSMFTSKVFETTEELLIENFMDATHTASVHAGLIRNQEASVQHHVTVTSDQHSVKVDFAETEERIGPGVRWLFGGSVRVRHSDEFLLPNLVRVIYEFNNQPRFVALIACSPITNGVTQAFVQLRYRFGVANWIIKPVLGMLTRRILRQDFEITRAQFANQKRFADLKEHSVASDLIAARVSRIRRAQTIDGAEIGCIVKHIQLKT